MSNTNCQICFREKFKYTCPRCNVVYCSVSCYKDEKHLKCSEEFYKQCIEEELVGSGNSGQHSKEELRKIYDILRRIRQSDAGLKPEDFDGDCNESLDSDDENPAEEIDHSDELDIAERLKGIDINNADEVWERLTTTERDEFKKLVSTGDIIKLVPDYIPWWKKENKNKKIVELSATNRIDIPKIMENIPKYSSICKKNPSPCLHYNLWNILTAYTCTVRFFRGEHLTNANEACAYFINLCVCLKYGTNFEDVEDAIISVEMEALTTGNNASQPMGAGSHNILPIESREQLQIDARQIMSSRSYKLGALSDILSMVKITKNILRESNKAELTFQKLFAFSNGMEQVTRTKVQQLIKKIEFYLSYVNRECETELC